MKPTAPLALLLLLWACAPKAPPEREEVRRTFYGDGQPWSELVYFRGLPDGPARTWHPDGKPASEGEYQLGRKSGRWRRWFEDGQVSLDANYRDGYLDGPFLESWPDGKVKSQGQLRMGRPSGHWIEWHRNGSKQLEGSYRDGEREGVWTAWFPDGSLRGRAVYARGKLVTDPLKKQAALDAEPLPARRNPGRNSRSGVDSTRKPLSILSPTLFFSGCRHAPVSNPDFAGPVPAGHRPRR